MANNDPVDSIYRALRHWFLSLSHFLSVSSPLLARPPFSFLVEPLPSSPAPTLFLCHCMSASTTPQTQCQVPAAQMHHPNILFYGNATLIFHTFAPDQYKDVNTPFCKEWSRFALTHPRTYLCAEANVWIRSFHIKVWESAWSRSCLTAVTGWLSRQRGVRVGDGLMLGQNGLLYDSNVVGVLAARGLETNSFPSHSFSWHPSPLCASPTATTLHPLNPQHLPARPLPRPQSFDVPRGAGAQVITANCHG